MCACVCSKSAILVEIISELHMNYREAMENNTKNSLVIFAIAGRPIDGLVDLRNISEFARLHTVRGV